jgi:hypothetical protein
VTCITARERKEDIVPLALELLQPFHRELKKKFHRLHARRRGTSPATPVARQHSRPEGRDRAHHDSPSEGDIAAIALPEEIRGCSHASRARTERGEPKNGSSVSELDVSPTGRQLVSLRELEDDHISGSPRRHRQPQDAGGKKFWESTNLALPRLKKDQGGRTTFRYQA